jgi:MFS family permease
LNGITDIGNARIAGLETSLSLQPGQYAWLLTAFYITYISFEWMTLLYRVIPAHIYITLCVLSWGLIASLQSVSTSFTSLIILRALLGIAEAAFSPGVPFYLSFFYKRSELAYRVGLFISAAPLATSCASTLAWLIVKIFQHGPLEPWRALFLIEGFPSIIIAFFAWHIIPDSPSTAEYLTPRERKVAKLRLQSDEPTKPTTSSSNESRLSLTDLLTTLLTPTTYLTPLMFFSANISFSSLPVFLPTILRSMSLSPLLSQLLSAPPYLTSFFFVLLTSHLSDRTPNSRAKYIILTSLLSSCSYASIALSGVYHAALGPTLTLLIRYISVFGAAMGFFSAITLIITWTLNNQQTATGKGTGMALLNVVGQCGPLVGTHLYPERDGPYYVKGMVVCAGFMLACAGLAAGLRWWLGVLNRRGEIKEDEEEEGWKLGRRMGGDGEVVEMEDLDGIGESEAGEGLMGNGKKRRKEMGQRRFVYVL